MRELIDKLLIFSLLFVPPVILLYILRDILPHLKTNTYKKIARGVVAFAVGGSFGLLSAFFAPPPIQDLPVQFLWTVAAPPIAALVFSQLAKRILKQRYEILFANCWMFYWSSLAFMCARINIP